jgi:hypothetical protein
MASLTSTGVRFAVGNEINNRSWMFQSTTTWVFYQASSPTGWTKSTSHNDKGLRVVSGTGGGFAGSRAFSSTMTSFNYSGNIGTSDATGATALAISQIPSHSHPMNPTNYALNAVPAIFNPDGSFNSWNGGDVQRSGGWSRNFPASGPAGSGSGHTHTISATAPISVPISLAVQYIDVIVCTFNG